MRKLFMQAISEVLKRHGIDPSADTYYLELRMPSHENFTVGKVGEQILVKIGDTVLALDYNQGNWFPISIENKLGKTICSFIENGNHMIIPFRFKRCMLFQGMLVKKIREQNYLENDEKQNTVKGFETQT